MYNFVVYHHFHSYLSPAHSHRMCLLCVFPSNELLTTIKKPQSKQWKYGFGDGRVRFIWLDINIFLKKFIAFFPWHQLIMRGKLFQFTYTPCLCLKSPSPHTMHALIVFLWKRLNSNILTCTSTE